MSLYLHDLSEFTDSLAVNAEGIFTYDGFDLYFEDSALTPLFIYSDGRLAGFALINRPPYTPPDVDRSIHEFFILRRLRGRGVGRRAAVQLFRTYPGRYIVGQLIKNVPAIGFWHSVYAHLKIEYVEREQVSGGESILSQRFTV